MEIAVIGVGHTEFGELWSKSLLDLMAAAQLEALADAGLEPGRIDEIFVGNMCAPMLLGQAHLGAIAADIMGINVPGTAVEAACASGAFAIRAGIASLLSGQSSIVMVVGVEKLMDTSIEQVATTFMGASIRDIEHDKGGTFPSIFALITRLYMQAHGITREQLAQISIKNHAHGKKNSLAHLQREITLDDFALAPMVADPLTLLDCSPVSDGAAVVILAKPEVAKKLGKPYIAILASEAVTDCVSIAERTSLITLKATQHAGERALNKAGLTRQDIDFIELHDAFSTAELMILEDLGFFKPGHAVGATMEGVTASFGSLPVNVSGGLKSKGHPVGATGVAQVVEIVKQLRGTAGERQLKNIEVGLAQNMGGVGTSVVVTILAQRG